jgi:hypothetical protein
MAVPSLFGDGFFFFFFFEGRRQAGKAAIFNLDPHVEFAVRARARRF